VSDVLAATVTVAVLTVSCEIELCCTPQERCAVLVNGAAAQPCCVMTVLLYDISHL
jgi:hypothetical protein